MRIQHILLFGIVVAAIVAVMMVGAPSDSNGGDPDPEGGKTDAIYMGPDVNDIRMGYVVVVEKSLDTANNTIKYRAVANDGYRFVCWTDSEGNVAEKSSVMTFEADRDRIATAVFAKAGVISKEFSWSPPVFGSDGSVSYPRSETISVTLKEEDYRASIRDASVQRCATFSVPSPVRLCQADGPVASVASMLEGCTEGMTDLQKAIVVLAFVQDAIDYQTDIDQYGSEEFWTTPMETLYSGYGDCEDTATLYVSIASAMGLDCGFVMFEHDRWGTNGTGHMSVAVALKDGASVIGASTATFIVDGVTYAYAETAVDPSKIDGYHPYLGTLSASYSIADGKWTAISCKDGVFEAGPTLAISGGQVSSVGGTIFGDDWSNPPAVRMHVGDSFCYRPMTNLSSTITASGSGLSFLTFDAESGILSGIADRAGTYTVVLDAVSTVGPEQHAVQTVTVIVSDSEESGATDYELRYGASGWTVETTEEEAPVEEDDGDGFKSALVAILAIIVLAIAAGRVFA